MTEQNKDPSRFKKILPGLAGLTALLGSLALVLTNANAVKDAWNKRTGHEPPAPKPTPANPSSEVTPVANFDGWVFHKDNGPIYFSQTGSRISWTQGDAQFDYAFNGNFTTPTHFEGPETRQW